MSENKEEVKKAVQESETELATKTLNVQNRRFYLDVKENAQGRFIKITESAVGGQKARVFMTALAAKEFVGKLDQVQQVLNTLPQHNSRSLAPEGLIKSFTIVKDSRRYFLDVKENERMRFLRVSMISNGARANIIIPGLGVKTIQETISDMLKEYFSNVESALGSKESRVMQSGNMTLYFDVGSNRNGAYLRISELSGNVRNSVVVREQDLIQFRDIINDVIESRSATANKDSAAIGQTEEQIAIKCD
ncbi:hypothetical protein Aperf_G00000027380 [Anoplocephala perfoliata]